MIDFLSSWLGILASVIALASWTVSAVVAGYRLGKKSAQTDERRTLLKESLERIYAPLRVYLLRTHITSSGHARYPRLGQRVRRCATSVRKLRLGQAMQAIFDRGVQSSSEVEFGGFSLDEVSKVASANPHVADPRLLDLIQAAKRARYESYNLDNHDLTSEELALVNHIWDQHERLSSKLPRDP